MPILAAPLNSKDWSQPQPAATHFDDGVVVLVDVARHARLHFACMQRRLCPCWRHSFDDIKFYVGGWLAV
jgi:hypothetical protein